MRSHLLMARRPRTRFNADDSDSDSDSDDEPLSAWLEP
jgi:hypothetical protein